MPLPCAFTDLASAYAVVPDKHPDVVKFVLAHDVISTLPNWDNRRLLHSEVLGEHLLDSLHTRRQRYKGFLSQQRLLTLK